MLFLDAGFPDEKLTKEIKKRKKHFIIGVRTTTKISIGRQKRIPIVEHLDTLTDKNFELKIKEGVGYFTVYKVYENKGFGLVPENLIT